MKKTSGTDSAATGPSHPALAGARPLSVLSPPSSLLLTSQVRLRLYVFFFRKVSELSPLHVAAEHRHSKTCSVVWLKRPCMFSSKGVCDVLGAEIIVDAASIGYVCGSRKCRVLSGLDRV